MPRTHWRPEKKEIDEWFEKHIQEVAVKENCNTKLMAERWKNRYILIESYEIFFVTLAIELEE